MSYVSPALRLLFTLMKLFRIFKKKPRRLEHGEAGDGPTASDVPAASGTPNTYSHPIGVEVLFQGVDPITTERVPSSLFNAPH